MESIPGNAVMITDPDGFITYANRSAAELRGFSQAALEMRHLGELFKSREELDQILKNARAHGGVEDEGWRVLPDGRRLWILDTYVPFFDDAKVVQSFAVVSRDLTRHKLSEMALKETGQRYRLLVEGIRDYAIFMLDPGGHIISWNEGAARIKGYEEYEVKGKHFSIFYTLEDLQAGKPENELETAIRTGRYEEEGWRVRKNGSLFWASVVITAMRDERNELIGFSKVTRDLSEKKAAEEKLRQSEEQYRMLVTSVKDYGIYMLDVKGNIVSWNTGASRILGYTREEVIGRHFSMFYPSADIDDEKPQIELRVARETGKYEEEAWRIRKDGTKFWASIVLTAIQNQDRKLVGFAKVTRDLTERMRADRALKESEENLKRTNLELMRSNADLERFTSVASHDLQEPLRTIRNYLSLVQKRLRANDREQVEHYISRTVSAADRMKELILSLLQYSRINADRESVTRIGLGVLFSEVLNNLRTAIDETNAEITFDNRVEAIMGHKVQIAQLFQNLVANALKFAGPEKPRIRVTAIDKKDHYLFSVADNGIGIDKKYQDQIFEVFRRLHGKSEYEGSGIGLAICKKIVELHRGRIWVESEPGKGAAFFFTIGKLHALVLHP